MKIAIIMKIVTILYNNGLRNILKNFIDDPNNVWDDRLIIALDEFFNYVQK